MSRTLLALALLAAACSTVPDRYQQHRSRWSRSDPARTAAPLELRPGMALGDLVAFAERHNPGLRAAWERWAAAMETVPQATALPDPRLGFGYYIDEVATANGDMNWRVGVSQPFPWPGKLELAGEAALARTEAAYEDFVAARLALVADVRRAWSEYVELGGAAEVTSAFLELLRQSESTARTRYTQGVGSDADTVRAQVELGRVEDELATLRDLRRPALARLNAVLGRAPAAAIEMPPAGDLWSPDLAPVVDEDRLRERIRSSSPALRAAEQRIVAAEAALSLAEKQVFPDVSLGLDYTNISSSGTGDGDDALAATLGFELPIRWQRRDAAVAQARAEQSAARSALAEAQHRLEAELEMSLYQVRDARRRALLYADTLVPKGWQSVESTRVAYQNGDADFGDLLDAQRVLLEFQLSELRARAAALRALADVERLTGVALLAVPMPQSKPEPAPEPAPEPVPDSAHPPPVPEPVPGSEEP